MDDAKTPQWNGKKIRRSQGKEDIACNIGKQIASGREVVEVLANSNKFEKATICFISGSRLPRETTQVRASGSSTHTVATPDISVDTGNES